MTVVTFVVPTYNEQEHIVACLQSIRNLELPPSVDKVEMVVVDNLSTDATAERARAQGAIVVAIPPQTISKSRNVGAATGSGDWLAFIDADCELHPRWLFYGVEHLSSPTVVAMGSRIAKPPPSATWVEEAIYELAEDNGEEPWRTVDWMTTRNLLVKRAAFQTIGGFAEELHTCEDTDLGYRLGRLGDQIFERRIETQHHRDARTLREHFRREAWRSQGNWAGLRRHGFVPSELPSLVVPFVFLTGLLLTVFFGVSTLVAPEWLGRADLLGNLPWSGLAALLALAGTLGLPLLMVLRKGILSRRPSMVLPCFLVSATYLAGRAIGSILLLRRPE
jgi:glycosyltransferase involved in cell wall biosynthesis